MRTFGKHFFRPWRNWGTMDCIYGTCFREWTIDMSNLCVSVYFRDLRLGKYVCMRSTNLCMRVHVLCCCSCKEHFGPAQKKKHRSKFISWVGFVRTWKHFMWFSNSPGPRSGSAGFENSRVRDFSGPRVRTPWAEPRVRKRMFMHEHFYMALRWTKKGWATFPNTGFRFFPEPEVKKT